MSGHATHHYNMGSRVQTFGKDHTADAIALELAKPGVPAKFIAYELPADFVQDLQDDIAAIRAADSDMDSDD